MRPFNLQEALAGKPVVTQSGAPASVLKMLNNQNESLLLAYPLAAIVGEPGNEKIMAYTADGKFYSDGADSDYNLFMAPEKRTAYINIWKNDDLFGVMHATVHYSPEQATTERTTSCSGKKKIHLGTVEFPFEL